MQAGTHGLAATTSAQHAEGRQLDPAWVYCARSWHGDRSVVSTQRLGAQTSARRGDRAVDCPIWVREVYPLLRACPSRVTDPPPSQTLSQRARPCWDRACDCCGLGPGPVRRGARDHGGGAWTCSAARARARAPRVRAECPSQLRMRQRCQYGISGLVAEYIAAIM